MNRNKFDFSDEQLIVCFYNYAYCVREIAMVRLINIVVMSLKIQIDFLIVIKLKWASHKYRCVVYVQ